MTDQEIIKAAWGDAPVWDWATKGPLRMPEPVEVTPFDPSEVDPPASAKDLAVIEFRRESGHLNGEPAWMIFGSLRGTEIVVAAEHK